MIDAPPEIEAFHRAMLAALRVDYFKPGLPDINAWRDFLYFQKTLADSEGGALTAADIQNAIALMRQENRDRKASWSLRFFRILREPESFRDLVLQSRKQKRERPPVKTVARQAGDFTIATEVDPAATAAPRSVKELADEFRQQMRGPDHARQNKSETPPRTDPPAS